MVKASEYFAGKKGRTNSRSPAPSPRPAPLSTCPGSSRKPATSRPRAVDEIVRHRRQTTLFVMGAWNKLRAATNITMLG